MELLSGYIFVDLTKLQELKFKEDTIRILPYGIFNSQTNSHLEELTLSRNARLCDCDFLRIIQMFAYKLDYDVLIKSLSDHCIMDMLMCPGQCQPV